MTFLDEWDQNIAILIQEVYGQQEDYVEKWISFGHIPWK